MNKLEMSRPILISDLDETLATKVRQPDGTIDVNINMRLLDIFHRAMLLRAKGKVDAILLLTNNTNMRLKQGGRYLELVNLHLVDVYNNTYPDKIQHMNDIFDMIYTGEPGVARGAPNRTYNLVDNLPTKLYPVVESKPGPSMTGLRFREVKNIETVRRMLGEIQRPISLNSLEGRIYFFDDEPLAHTIKGEIEPKGGSYIKITPPYGEGEDATDFDPITNVLTELEGQTQGGGPKASRRMRSSSSRRMRSSRRSSSTRTQRR